MTSGFSSSGFVAGASFVARAGFMTGATVGGALTDVRVCFNGPDDDDAGRVHGQQNERVDQVETLQATNSKVICHTYVGSIQCRARK